MTTDATPKCPYCGQPYHPVGYCPLVKAVDYYESGAVQRVEFFPDKNAAIVQAAAPLIEITAVGRVATGRNTPRSQ